MTVRAFIGLGSNLGDRTANIAAALRALDAVPGVSVAVVSSAYETKPWGFVDQPRFANAVAALDVSLDAHELLAICKRVEASLGRVAVLRYGPRPIDIDLLLFDDTSIDSFELTVPHPRLLERDFVVTPLLEVAPDVALPDGTRPDPEQAVEGRVTGVLGRVPGF